MDTVTLTVRHRDLGGSWDGPGELADQVGDVALAALLRGKPAFETIPATSWWLVAETLRPSVTVRRWTLAGPTEVPDARKLLIEATMFTDLATAELIDATAATLPPDSEPAIRGDDAPVAIYLSVLRLARLLVRREATSPETLLTALAEHRRALALVADLV